MRPPLARGVFRVRRSVRSVDTDQRVRACSLGFGGGVVHSREQCSAAESVSYQKGMSTHIWSLMDHKKIYDYLTLARQRIFNQARSLTPEQYTREYPIGPGTLAKVLTHTYIAEYYYIERLELRDLLSYDQWPIRDDNPPSFATLEAVWTRQAETTRAALACERNWAAPITYRVTTDEGREEIITALPTDIVTQLILHETHHRAQAINILRHLGFAAEELDYNTMMYDRREATA